MPTPNFINDLQAGQYLQKASHFRNLAAGVKSTDQRVVIVRTNRSALSLISIYGRHTVWKGTVHDIAFDSKEQATGMRSRLLREGHDRCMKVSPLKDYYVGLARYLEYEAKQLMESVNE